MSQLNLQEHLCCDASPELRRLIFTVYHFREGEELPDKRMEDTVIFFLLEGKLLVNCGPFLGCKINDGSLFVIPNGTAVSGMVVKDAVVLRCILNMEGHLCNRYFFESLKRYVDVKSLEYRLGVLPIYERLREFALFLVRCLEDGLDCLHFHNYKSNELILLLREYYTKEELAHFFYPILSQDWDINSFVWSHYKKAADVNELAEMAHLSLVTFNRRFKKAFGETAARWLERRRAEDVLREIQLSRKSFSEIAMELRFSSSAYLTTFCKRYFGKTPKELRADSKPR